MEKNSKILFQSTLNFIKIYVYFLSSIKYLRKYGVYVAEHTTIVFYSSLVFFFSASLCSDKFNYVLSCYTPFIVTRSYVSDEFFFSYYIFLFLFCISAHLFRSRFLHLSFQFKYTICMYIG